MADIEQQLQPSLDPVQVVAHAPSHSQAEVEWAVKRLTNEPQDDRERIAGEILAGVARQAGVKR